MFYVHLFFDNTTIICSTWMLILKVLIASIVFVDIKF